MGADGRSRRFATQQNRTNQKKAINSQVDSDPLKPISKPRYRESKKRFIPFALMEREQKD